MSDQANTTIVSKASKEEGAKRASARSEVYLFLSRSFAYPKSPLDELYHRAVAAAAVSSADTLKLLSQLRLPSPSEIETDYIGTFGHTITKDFPPYETEYGQGNFHMQAYAFADIAAFYRAFGAQVASGERLDHLTTELEFMYLLTYKEAYALISDKEESAEVCRSGQRRFLEKHLGQWAPRCLELLAKQGQGFYRQVATIADGWLRAEMIELAASPSPRDEQSQANSVENRDLFYYMDNLSDLCKEAE